MAVSSRRSASGARRSDWRSTSSSRWRSSRCACIDTYSPAAIENAPATSPATPVSRTIVPAGWAPATPRISETFVTSPSLTPKIAARAPPERMSRWWWTSAPFGSIGPSGTSASVATPVRLRELAESVSARAQVDRQDPAPDPPGSSPLLVPERRPRRPVPRRVRRRAVVGPAPARRHRVRHRQRATLGVLGGDRPVRPLPARPGRLLRHRRRLQRRAQPALRRRPLRRARPPAEQVLRADLVPLTGDGWAAGTALI